MLLLLLLTCREIGWQNKSGAGACAICHLLEGISTELQIGRRCQCLDLWCTRVSGRDQ